MTDLNLWGRLAAIEDRLSALEHAHSGETPLRTTPPPLPTAGAVSAPPQQTLPPVAPHVGPRVAPHVAPHVAPLAPLQLPSHTPPRTPPRVMPQWFARASAPPPIPAEPTPPKQAETELGSESRIDPEDGPTSEQTRVPKPASGSATAHTTDYTQPDELERFFGVQVAAWIGAIVVIAAISIFAKFAIDAGWLQLLPPSVKLAAAYALAGAFVVAGSLTRERLGRLPSAALLSAGIGGLFVATCVGITPLNVFDPLAALIVGVAVAVLGGALTLRSGELTVGVISLLGAYIVPTFTGIYLTQPGNYEAVVLSSALYLSGVYAVALALARLGPPHFGWLRFAGVAQTLSALGLLFSTGLGSIEAAVFFTGLWWAMAVGECSLAAMRGVSPRLNTSITVTATAIAATLAFRGAFVLNPWTDMHAWLPTIMAMAAACGAGVLRGFAAPINANESERAEDPEAYDSMMACALQSNVLAILAGALVMAQVGAVVRGGALSVTWVAMGAAAIFAGRRSGQLMIARLGAASIMLGLIAMLFYTRIVFMSVTMLFEFPVGLAKGQPIPWGLRFGNTHIAPLLVAFTLLFAARFWSMGCDRTRRAPLMSGMFAASASLLWIFLSFSTGAGYATTMLLLAVPLAALVAGRTQSLIKVVAMVGSVIAMLSWFGTTLISAAHFNGAWQPHPTGGAIAAALVVGSIVMLGKRFRGEGIEEPSYAIAFGFALVSLATLTLIDRLSGDTARDLDTAVAWASIVVAPAATVTAILARHSKMQLIEQLGFVATGLCLMVTLFATISNAGKPPSNTEWLFHWLLTPFNLALVVLVGCGFALRGELEADRPERRYVAVASLTALIIGSTALVYRFFDPRVGAPFESSRTMQGSALSVWLAVVAVLLIIYGFKRSTAGARWMGLVLLGLVAFKVLAIDMSNAATMWRVAALLATGLLLVATSTVYTRASKAALTSAKKSAKEDAKTNAAPE